MSCSPRDLGFSLTCRSGFTTVARGVDVKGICHACAMYCRKCEIGGAGTCDSGGCELGSVQILGTNNCTLCLNGCSKCSSTDLSYCLECVLNRYLTNSSECKICDPTCKTCSSAFNCTTC